MLNRILLLSSILSLVQGFAPTNVQNNNVISTTHNLPFTMTTTTRRTPTRIHADVTTESETTTNSDTKSTEETPTTAIENPIDPKTAVKLFGRLAEKYILLDSTGGMCCYSACTDCEYRLPDGGYRMADQSAARPKWIPSYDERRFEDGKEHVSKWGTEIFCDGGKKVVEREEFVERLVGMTFVPPLGGPFLAARAAGLEDDEEGVEAAGILFDLLADGKEKLTKHRMGMSIKRLAGGEEGMVWSHFAAAMTE